MSNFQYLEYGVENSIATVTLNNPKKANSLNEIMWDEIRRVFLNIQDEDSIKVCVIKSNGKHFSSGIDINYLKTVMEKTKAEKTSEQTAFLRTTISGMQEAFNAISNCNKPVIAAIHGLCIGGAVDLIAACDIRYSLYTSYFSIMETKLGIVADMGTLQRLPRIIGDGHLKELALTSKVFSGFKAKGINLVNKCFFTRASLYKNAYILADEIAKLPPYAVQGTKETINFSRENTVQEGLSFIADKNSVQLNSPEMEQELAKLIKMMAKK